MMMMMMMMMMITITITINNYNNNLKNYNKYKILMSFITVKPILTDLGEN